MPEKACIRRVMGNSEGAAAIEFAIILPIFFLLIMGMVEFGFVFSMRQIIVNASREGARYGIAFKVNNDATGTRTPPINLTPSIQSWVLATTPDGRGVGLTSLLPADAYPSVTVDGSGAATGKAGDNLKVKVTCNYHFLVVNRFIPFFPDKWEIGAVTVMRVE